MFLSLLACVAPPDAPADDALDTALDDTAADTDPSDTDPSDTDPSDTGDTGTEPDDSLLFGQEILAFSIDLDAAALESLAADPRTDVHATFTFQGVSYDVGLHLKGNGSFRDMTGKASFKVDFHEWDEERRFYGRKRLTLNNMIQDGSMSSEHAAYYLYGELGLVTPRHGYAQVTVNGELFGLYGVVETVDGEFVERWFPEDDGGNVYEGGYGADVMRDREDHFERKVDGAPADRSDLLALLAAADASTPADHLEMLQAQFADADALLDLWAADLVGGNDDAYPTLANNYLLYHAPEAGRWTMIPWGPDQAFRARYDGTEPDVTEPPYGDLLVRCQASPACAARFAERMDRVLDVWEAGPFYAYVDAETARIEDACRTDPRSEWGDYGCRDALAAMRAWVRARPDVVRAQIAGG